MTKQGRPANWLTTRRDEPAWVREVVGFEPVASADGEEDRPTDAGGAMRSPGGAELMDRISRRVERDRANAAQPAPQERPPVVPAPQRERPDTIRAAPVAPAIVLRRLLTRREVAGILSLSVDSIDRIGRDPNSGLTPVYPRLNAPRYLPADVESYLQRLQGVGAAKGTKT